METFTVLVHKNGYDLPFYIKAYDKEDAAAYWEAYYRGSFPNDSITVLEPDNTTTDKEIQ